MLSTRFGKSLIYQSCAIARNVRNGRPLVIIVITPEQKIVQEQLRSNDFELTEAVEVTSRFSRRAASALVAS